MLSQVLEFISNGLDYIKDKATRLKNYTKEGFKDIFSTLPSRVQDFLRSAYEKVPNWSSLIDITIGIAIPVLGVTTVAFFGKFTSGLLFNQFLSLIGFGGSDDNDGLDMTTFNYLTKSASDMIGFSASLLVGAPLAITAVISVVQWVSGSKKKTNEYTITQFFDFIENIGNWTSIRETIQNYFDNIDTKITEAETLCNEFNKEITNYAPAVSEGDEGEVLEDDSSNSGEKLSVVPAKIKQDNSTILLKIKDLYGKIKSQEANFSLLQKNIEERIDRATKLNEVPLDLSKRIDKNNIILDKINKILIQINQSIELYNALKMDTTKIIDNAEGGAPTKCLKLPSLKQRLLSRLVKFGAEQTNENDLQQTDCDDSILPTGKAFVLDTSISMNDASDCEPAMDPRSRSDKLDCLHKTGLKRRHRANTDESKRWTTLNKNMNSPNLLVTPNMLQILKGSTFPSAMNYQLGGNNIEENREFIKTKNQDIKIQYSYQIVSLLKKALQRLNNNGIYLDKKTIDEIQAKIEQLRDAETALAKYAENIVQAGRISASRPENNNVMDDTKLSDYVKQHKMLVQNADKTAIKLNTVFIKLLELFNEKGDKIMSAIESSI